MSHRHIVTGTPLPIIPAAVARARPRALPSTTARTRQTSNAAPDRAALAAAAAARVAQRRQRAEDTLYEAAYGAATPTSLTAEDAHFYGRAFPGQAA